LNTNAARVILVTHGAFDHAPQIREGALGGTRKIRDEWPMKVFHCERPKREERYYGQGEPHHGLNNEDSTRESHDECYGRSESNEECNEGVGMNFCHYADRENH
jgi:hypothetical protein